MRILVNLLVNLALVKAKLKNSDICFQRAGHSRRHGGYLWPLPKHKPLACSRLGNCSCVALPPASMQSTPTPSS